MSELVLARAWLGLGPGARIKTGDDTSSRTQAVNADLSRLASAPTDTLRFRMADYLGAAQTAQTLTPGSGRAGHIICRMLLKLGLPVVVVVVQLQRDDLVEIPPLPTKQRRG